MLKWQQFFIFMSRIYFILSCFELEDSFIILGPGFKDGISEPYAVRLIFFMNPESNAKKYNLADLYTSHNQKFCLNMNIWCLMVHLDTPQSSAFINAAIGI